MLTSEAYQFDRDKFLQLEGKKVKITLSKSTFEIKPESGNSTSIKLSDLKDADFTNTFKGQFILTTNDNKQYIFGLFKPWKNRSMGEKFYDFFIRWNVFRAKRTLDYTNEWKEAFQTAVPKAYRTRKEVQAKNLALGIVLSVVVLGGILAGVIILIAD